MRVINIYFLENIFYVCMYRLITIYVDKINNSESKPINMAFYNIKIYLIKHM